MTALTQYARLESTGLWRATPEEDGREVVVSFGHATLVLSDGSGLPLTHWSLPAVTRLNPGSTPATYAPDAEGSETLEVEDDLMVSAIEKVRASVARRQRGPGRLRLALLGGGAALAVGLAVLWLPGALRREALEVVPPSKRSEIGATLLGLLQRELGPACRAPLGVEALGRLHARALGEDAGGQAVVLPLGPEAPLALPGDIVVLSRRMVEEAVEPAVVAGQILAALATEQDRDALAPLLDAAGPWATLRLLATGRIDPNALEEYAGRLLAAPPPELGADRLGPAFAQAEVPLSPYALNLDSSGERVADLLAADPYAGGVQPLILSDAEWVSLQGICRG